MEPTVTELLQDIKLILLSIDFLILVLLLVTIGKGYTIK